MPQTQIYLDNETYVAFLQKPKLERERIRKKAADIIKQEVQQNGD